MLANLAMKVTLALAIAAPGNVVDPKQDPDVQPHIARGYFQQTETTKPSSSITKERTQKIAQDFLEQFSPLLHEKGLNFAVIVDWENSWFSAHARFEQKTSSAVLWGGFLRAPGMTEAIIATTLCHELGHLVAGPPLQTISETDNFSTEGQSDFYAGQCLVEFSRKHPEYFRQISFEVRSFCGNSNECAVALEGGLQTVRFMQKWGFEVYKPVSLTERSAPAKKFIANTYPDNQCRLDSFIQRAQCLKNGTSECLPPPCWWPMVMRYPPAQ